jgi:hypothetical protein
MSKIFLTLARAFIGWGLLCQVIGEWCIEEGYRHMGDDL